MAEDVYSPFKVFAHMDKIEQLKRGKIITPVFIQVDLTNRCNLNCNFCFYKIHKLSAFDPKAEIPFETMKRMLRECKDIGVKAIEWSIDGDEPILIEKDGEIKNVRIKDFVDSFFDKPCEGYEYKEVKIDIKALCWNSKTFASQALEKKRIIGVLRHPAKRLYKIILETGRQICTTGSHSIYCFEGGQLRPKKVEELKVGDLIPVIHNIPTGKGKRMPELCRLLGYYLAEGSSCKRYSEKHKRYFCGIRFTFNKKEMRYIRDVANLIKKLFNSKAFLVERKNTIQVCSSSCKFFNFLESLNIGHKAKEKQIPDIVFNADYESKIEFLKGYFAGDGYFRQRKSGAELSCKTASRKLASDLVFLLSTMGIYACVEEQRNPERMIEGRVLKPSTCYHVIIYGKRQLLKLKDVIEHLGKEFIYDPRPEDKELVLDKIILLPVREIQIIEKDTIVYDITVEDNYNFIGGLGNILCFDTGGGEPLLHPNFKDIVKYAKKLGFEMALVTNGTLLDDETLELIKDFEWVRFSIDAVTPQTFKKIKGVDLFDKVIENLRKLIEIKSENNVIGYSFVVCRDNYTEIHEAAKFAKLLGCDNIRFSLAMTPLKEKLFEGIWDECVYLMERAKREEDENFKVFQFSNRIYDLAGEVYSECCYYTDFVGVVAPSGYFPCCRLKCDANFRFGSIDEPFKKVWFGEKRLRFLKMVRRGCPYDCWMTQKNKIIAALVNPPKKHVNFI